MGKVIFLLFCALVAVSGQDVFQNFVNRTRDLLVNSSRKVLNRSLKVEELAAPVVSSLQRVVQQSPLFQIPVFTIVNTTNNVGSSEPEPATKNVAKRQSFLDSSDTTGYLFGGGSRTCLSPSGQSGKCSDLASCPVLLLDLPNLRKSICFQNLFTPGVCCPSDSSSGSIEPERTTRRATTTTTSTTTTTTQRPFILDILQLLSPTSSPSKPPPETRPPAIRPPIQPILSNEIPQDFGQSFKNKDVCGHVTVASLRIVGGEVARVGEWPWMAAIYLTGPNGREYWCGGSLITPKHVLTAAHCTQDGKQKRFDSSQFSVELGRTNLITGDLSKMQAFNVKEVRVHPNFRAHGFYNDVAIFTLDGTAKYDDYVRPVCLPSAEDDSFSLVGEIPTVIGFGATDYGGRESNILREVQIPVWKNDDCDRAYIQPITDIFVCAGYADGGKDACQGDSGGPLQLYKNGNWVQIGLVSFGNKCAEPGYPGVYTRMTKFARWIEANSVL